MPRRGGHGTSQRVTGSRRGEIPRFFIYLLLYTYLSIYFLVNAAFYFFYHLPFICRFIDSYEIIMIIVTDFDNFFRVCFSHLLQVPPLSLPTSTLILQTNGDVGLKTKLTLLKPFAAPFSLPIPPETPFVRQQLSSLLSFPTNSQAQVGVACSHANALHH